MCACQLKEDTKFHITAGDHTLFSESPDKHTDCTKRTDSYNPTAVYVPAKHNAKATELNILLWLHGFYVTDHKNIFSPSKDLDPKLRESVSKACEDSGKDVVLIAPFMGHRWMVKGDDGLAHSTGDALGLKRGVQPYLEDIVDQIAQELYPGFKLVIKNLIVAGHSAGGGLMQAVTKTMDEKFLANLKECWGFDCMYQEYGCWADSLRPPDGVNFFFYLADSSSASLFKEFWKFAYGTPQSPDPQPMHNVHLAPSATFFRPPRAKGERRPPPPEGIAFESLSDLEVFQTLDDIQQKEQNGASLTSYEKFRKQVDPLLDRNSMEYEGALKPLMSHFGVVQRVLKTRIANMLDAKNLSSVKGLKQIRSCPAPGTKSAGKR
jgi:hypothetical protein